MAKGTRKRVQNDKNHSGCMWGFINIFDFRHGRPSHKLLQDRKRGSRRVAGSASLSDELNKAGDRCEICKDVIAGEEHETETLDKLSVKLLMEEEMFEPEKPSHGRKKSWHSKKKSFDLSDIHFVSERPTHRKHKSLSSLDVTGIMSELCSQVRVKDDVDCLNHNQIGEDVSVPPSEDSSVIEERLGEATRVFVRHFVEGRNTEEGKTQSSGELVEALRILNSNKDRFLKLLRDPDSELVKHLENLEDQPVENSKEQGKSKNQRFFWRRFKGVDRKDASRIVVLKPEDIRSEDQDERGSSRFSFTEFTRKLKMAVRKEPENVDNVGGESLEMASPSRDCFFNEKIPKSSVGTKNIPKDSSPEQQISNIYTEAKRHLAEIVGNTDVDVEFLSGQDPRSLGRILSYSDYNSISPFCCSPGKDGEEIAAQQVQEENASDAGLANNKAEETGDNLEVPKDEVEEIHGEGNSEMKTPDDFETENRIPSDILAELGSPNAERNDPVEVKPKDSEEEQVLELNMDELMNRPSSPLASSSSVSSRTEDFEDQESVTDRSGRPSPISVLEPIFIEDAVSPPSIKSFSVSELIQPRQIKFEDHISRTPRSRTWEDEKNTVLDFVEAVVRASSLTHHQLLERFLFSERLLDPWFFDQVCFDPDNLVYDPKLLFDLVDDILTEVCNRDFDGIPLIRQMKLSRKNLVDEIRRGVDWHLQSEHTKRTLDQTVARDFLKLWTWMDLRVDSESVGVEIEEEIFDELVEDTITSFVG